MTGAPDRSGAPLPLQAVQVAEALLLAGEARRALQQLAAVAEAARDAADARLHARAALAAAQACAGLQRTEEMLRWARESRLAAEAVQDVGAVAQAAVVEAEALAATGQPARAVEALQQALRSLAADAPSKVRARVLAGVGRCCVELELQRQAVVALRLALQAGGAALAPEQSVLLRCQLLECTARAWDGLFEIDLPAAWALLEPALVGLPTLRRDAEALGQQGLRVQARLAAARCLTRASEFQLADDLLREATAFSADMGALDAALMWYELARAQRGMGAVADMQRSLQRAQSLMPPDATLTRARELLAASEIAESTGDARRAYDLFVRYHQLTVQHERAAADARVAELEGLLAGAERVQRAQRGGAAAGVAGVAGEAGVAGVASERAAIAGAATHATATASTRTTASALASIAASGPESGPASGPSSATTSVTLLDRATGMLSRRGLAEAITALRDAPCSVALALFEFGAAGRSHAVPLAQADPLMASAAEQLRLVLRANDPLARVGRLGCVVLLPGASATTARLIGERCRAQLAQATLATGAPVIAPPHAGIVLLHEGDSLDDLLRRADALVAASRQSGGAVTGEHA